MTRTLVAVCALAASLAACGAAPSSAGDAPNDAPAADTPRPSSPEVAYLERRLELAKGDAFYLLLDRDGTQLRLMYGGAVLQQYPVRSMSVGRPRTAFATVAEPADWRINIWDHGVLVPARPTEEQLMRMVSADDTAPEAAIPPTAEEAIFVPARFRVRFEGGLALEVRRAPGAEGSWWDAWLDGWALRWQDVRSALWSSDRDVVRIRVVLDRESADLLYRALPPEIRLLVSRGLAGN